MTHPSPQEASVLLILGELRGDVKSVLLHQRETAARINALEDTTDQRFVKIEARVKVLEDFKTRVAYLAIGVGAASGFLGPFAPVMLKALGVL